MEQIASDGMINLKCTNEVHFPQFNQKGEARIRGFSKSLRFNN